MAISRPVQLLVYTPSTGILGEVVLANPGSILCPWCLCRPGRVPRRDAFQSLNIGELVNVRAPNVEHLLIRELIQGGGPFDAGGVRGIGEAWLAKPPTMGAGVVAIHASARNGISIDMNAI